MIDNQPTIKKSRCLVFAAMQVALLGPTSAANSKSDECGLASVYSTNSEETASEEDTQPQLHRRTSVTTVRDAGPRRQSSERALGGHTDY